MIELNDLNDILAKKNVLDILEALIAAQERLQSTCPHTKHLVTGGKAKGNIVPLSVLNLTEKRMLKMTFKRKKYSTCILQYPRYDSIDLISDAFKLILTKKSKARPMKAAVMMKTMTEASLTTEAIGNFPSYTDSDTRRLYLISILRMHFYNSFLYTRSLRYLQFRSLNAHEQSDPV